MLLQVCINIQNSRYRPFMQGRKTMHGFLLMLYPVWHIQSIGML